VTTPTGYTSRLTQVLAQLLDCACTRLADYGRPVCFCCTRHAAGAGPMDFCDCGCTTPSGGQGSLLGRVVAVAPSSTPFTTATSAPGHCPRPDSTATLELAVYRCAASMSDDGQPPDCATQTAEAEAFILDAALLRSSVLCCASDLDDQYGYRVQPTIWTPIGPAGGCAGGALQVLASGVEKVVEL
jgi:hypothetical protein